jgi:hypothetical protein
MKAISLVCAALLTAGAVHAQRNRSTYTPSIGEAPAHLKYMSPRCAALHDSIRTGPARGLNSDSMSAARKDYSRDCRENEGEAQQQLSRERQDKRTQVLTQKQGEAKAMERTRQQEQLCGESKRILKNKNARTDLNDGEKAELKRFQEGYLARCS